MLKKQSIRKGTTIKLNGVVLEKDEIIELSKSFSLSKEKFFRLILSQGGKMNIEEGVIEIRKDKWKNFKKYHHTFVMKKMKAL